MSETFKEKLANIRHDLRTPVGHIIGYGEMLEEDILESDWKEFLNDLRNVLNSGRTLVELIDELLGSSKETLDDLDIPFIKEQFRTQLNHIIGYNEILMELAEEQERNDLMGDLEKIDKAGKSILDIIDVRFSIHTFDDTINETVSSTSGKTKTEDIESSLLGVGGDILVVDDDSSNRELLQRRLEKQGYHINTLTDGDQIIDYLKENKPDLILLDMMMPNIGGKEALELLKADPVFRNIPVIMISGLDSMDQIVKCILLGAEDYIFKPFNPVLLKARINATLEKYRLRKQSALKLKVFISSPGDVNPERRMVQKILNHINEELSGEVHLSPVLWEDEPLLASETAQSQIIAPHETDIYIAIFWSRFGTMLPDNITRKDGSRYGSGSEFEFEDAINGYEKSKSPDILVYYKTIEPVVSLTDRKSVMSSLEQKELLDGFIKNWFSTADGKSIARVYHAFETIDEFEDLVYKHIKKLVLKKLEKSGKI
jgi:DNA-binding response OmpR family regulator